MHQSFVTTAPPPTGKGGDYDFSAFSALLKGGKLEVKTLLFVLPFAIENLPGVRILMPGPNVKTPSFPLTERTLEK